METHLVAMHLNSPSLGEVLVELSGQDTRGKSTVVNKEKQTDTVITMNYQCTPSNDTTSLNPSNKIYL